MAKLVYFNGKLLGINYPACEIPAEFDSERKEAGQVLNFPLMLATTNPLDIYNLHCCGNSGNLIKCLSSKTFFPPFFKIVVMLDYLYSLTLPSLQISPIIYRLCSISKYCLR